MKGAYLILICLAVSGCEQRRPVEVREFPAGFHGWAVIVWDIPGYPQLPTDHGKLVERFPTGGVIITSSTQHFGFARDESYFVDSSGHRLPARPTTPFGAVGGIQQGHRTMDYFQLFVGTEEELRAAPRDARQIESLFDKLGRAPNQQRGANGSQPIRSETSSTPSTAGSRRSP